MRNSLAIGVGAGLAFILIGYAWEGGNFAAFLSISAMLIVFGGTICAAVAGAPIETLRSLPGLVRLAMRADEPDVEQIVVDATVLGAVARATSRKEAALYAERIADPFLRQGAMCVVEEWGLEDTARFLASTIAASERRHESGIAFLDAMGGYAPTMGIIGTVMGLVNVLGNLSDPQDIGPHIATAFIATLIGVGSANILWLPFATRLRDLHDRERQARLMAVEATELLVARRDGLRILDILLGYLPPARQEAVRARAEEARKEQLRRSGGLA